MNERKAVLVGGCFDVLHYGHIHFLKKAKALGNYLIVALESDKNVKRLKGNKRPVHDQNMRREMLEALRFVDQVIILADKMTDKDYDKLVKIINPQVIAVTSGDPVIDKKKKQAQEIDAKVIEIPRIDSLSTSQIIEISALD
jgi:FAD synthetase